MERFEVIADLFVDAVTVDDDGGLRVELQGATESMGSVTWRFTSADERQIQLSTLLRWEAERTTLTYFRHGESVALVDERAVLERALAGCVADES